MTEDEYKKLCSMCDSILLDDSSALERIAIPWLNVIREHPVFLKQYEDKKIDCSQTISRILSFSNEIPVPGTWSLSVMLILP